MTNPTPTLGASCAARPNSHLRLFPESIRQNWLDGFYHPAGYLYHLMLAFQAVGLPFQIGQVEVFCRQWQLSELDFYSGIAQLRDQGLLPDPQEALPTDLPSAKE